MRYANVTLIHSSEIVNMVGRLILFSLSWMKYRSFHQILREREELVGSWTIANLEDHINIQIREEINQALTLSYLFNMMISIKLFFFDNQ